MTARRFDDMRPTHAAARATGEEPVEVAIRRLFLTPDGRRVLDHWLAEAAEPAPLNAPDAALREREGARRFVETVRRTARDDAGSVR